MKLLHLSYSCSSSDGGISISVDNLIKEQNNYQNNASWLTFDKRNTLFNKESILEQIHDIDPSLVHIHGLWRTPSRIAPKLTKKFDIPLVISPHGMLDPWAMKNSRWKKNIAWFLWEYKALCSASCLQALNYSEAHSIRRLVPNRPIAIIPNAVSIPKESNYKVNSNVPWKNKIPQGDKILLFLGRFHQKKGIYPLIKAWNSIANSSSSKKWWLVLIGYGDNGKLKNELTKNPISRCLVLDPVFGEDKENVLSSSTSFVLPSYSEGLPMAALEAMSYKLPCLLSSACNIPEAISERAAIQADPNSENLTRSLNELFELTDEEMFLMGRIGRSIVDRNYSWPRVVKKTYDLYSWILGESEKPKYLLLDNKNV